jgi:hypothetical protein
MNFGVYTMKTEKRKKDGADDIHHEGSGRRTP